MKSRTRIISHLLAALAAVAIFVVGLIAGPYGNQLAHAADASIGEGNISYTGGTASDGTPAATDTVSLFDDAFGNTLSASKTAGALDANDDSNVKLSFPGGESNQEYDIVVMMDGTSSFSSVSTQLEDFLRDVATRLADKNAIVNIGVVDAMTYAYGTTAHTFTDVIGSDTDGLVQITPDNVEATLTRIKSGFSSDATGALIARFMGGFTGTNIEAGVKAARRLLDVGTAPAANKYMVLMTDGGSYAWDGDSTAASESSTLTPAADSYVQAGYWDNGFHSAIGTSEGDDLEVGCTGSDSYTNPTGANYGKTWWDFVMSSDAAAECPASPANPTVGPDAGVGPADDLLSAPTLGDYAQYKNSADSYPQLAEKGFNPVIYDRYISLDKGDAHAAVAIKSFVDAGGQLITFSSPYASLPRGVAIATKFMDWVDSVSVQSFPISSTTQAADVTAALNLVTENLLYAINSGTMTDTIGNQFDLTMTDGTLSAADIALQIGDTTTTGVIDASNPNQIDFGTLDPVSGLYPYTAEYIPGTGAGTSDGAGEQIILTINVPVEKSNPVSLLYGVHLNRETTPTGWHNDVPLNESAYLCYTDTAGDVGTDTDCAGDTGKVTFPVPMTDYFVASPAQPVPPTSPQGSELAQTGVDTSGVVALASLVLLAGAGALFVCRRQKA